MFCCYGSAGFTTMFHYLTCQHACFCWDYNSKLSFYSIASNAFGWPLARDNLVWEMCGIKGNDPIRWWWLWTISGVCCQSFFRETPPRPCGVDTLEKTEHVHGLHVVHGIWCSCLVAGACMDSSLIQLRLLEQVRTEKTAVKNQSLWDYINMVLTWACICLL